MATLCMMADQMPYVENYFDFHFYTEKDEDYDDDDDDDDDDSGKLN